MLNLLLVLYVGLGATHPLTTEVHNFVVDYERHEPLLESYIPPPHIQKAHIPAYMIRYVQMRLSRWVDSQLMSSIQMAPPQLTGLFDKMFVGEQWTPPFPAAYLEPAFPRQQLLPRQQPQQPQLQQQQQPQQPQLQQGGADDSRVTNARFNPALAQYRDIQVRTRQIYQRVQAAGVALPVRTDGRERCLAFHVKGMCNLRCGRSYDHTNAPLPPPSAAEDQALCDWCAPNWHA
jgi:hypothetical protein